MPTRVSAPPVSIQDDLVEELAWMALADLGRRATGPWARLAAELGGARAVFCATEQILARLDLSPAGIARVRCYDAWTSLERCRAWCRAREISLASLASPAYPALLRHIADPPLMLYYRGHEPARLVPAVAVVGSRRASRYGKRVARALGRELAGAGVAVISGLAEGIDTAAHEGALAAGTSVAVLAGGLDRVYPRRNKALFARVADSGAVLSEYAPGTPSRGFRFPIRNRIITGMASATVVVEAAERSGSLVSARLAAEQGREVFAVPGNLDSVTSRGTNMLIRDGCAPLIELADLTTAVGLQTAPTHGAAARENSCRDVDFAGPDGARVLAVLDATPTHFEDIVSASGLDGARIMELLTALELDGAVERSAGGMFSRRGQLALRGAQGPDWLG